MKPFLIPDDFRVFMQAVVVDLDSPVGAPFLDAEDALHAECGYGGRIDGVDTFRFRYITRDGVTRWDIVLREAQIRDIADGLLIEVDAEPFELVRTTRRAPVGEPLLIWGPAPDEALHVALGPELLVALELLHQESIAQPRLARLWTPADDQLVFVMSDDRVALYVVESADGYATSMGDPSLTGSFAVLDHEGHRLEVPLADCVSWDYARRALAWFVDHGDLGDVPVEGRIPSLLLMFGDIDRATALAARRRVPRALAHTRLRDAASTAPFPAVDRHAASTTPFAAERTLPSRVEPAGGVQRFAAENTQENTRPIDLGSSRDALERADLARRLLDILQAGALIQLAPDPSYSELGHRLGVLLQQHGRAAEQSVEAADWLACEIAAMRGVERLLATGAELQRALRRARDE